jgi:hypothetical protein
MSGGLRLVAVLSATLAGLWGSDVALAQEYPPPIPGVGPAGAGAGPGGIGRLPTEERAAGAEVAFTGADITIWMLLVVVLTVAGIILLVLSRRRARARA